MKPLRSAPSRSKELLFIATLGGDYYRQISPHQTVYTARHTNDTRSPPLNSSDGTMHIKTTVFPKKTSHLCQALNAFNGHISPRELHQLFLTLQKSISLSVGGKCIDRYRTSQSQ